MLNAFQRIMEGGIVEFDPETAFNASRLSLVVIEDMSPSARSWGFIVSSALVVDGAQLLLHPCPVANDGGSEGQNTTAVILPLDCR
jgi:hypothetical protein